jgi:large repetitive protein
MVTTAQVPVGTVSSLKGNVSVIPATGGPARPLQVGDVIHPGDRIISAAGAQIQVKDAEGKLWAPRDNAPLNTTAADDAATASKPDAGTAKAKMAATVLGAGDNLDDVIAAVNTGNEEDATAAGLAGGGGGGTLGEGLRVDRVTEVVSAQEFNYGTGDRAQVQNAQTAVPLVNANDAPVITDTPTDPDRPTTSFDPTTGNYNVTTPEDTPVSGQVKATDADGDPLTYTLSGTSPAHGTVVVNADGTWTYAPGKDYNGSDAFTVIVSDGRGGTATSTVLIGITPVNDPPVITDVPNDPDHPGTTFDPTTGNYQLTTPEDTPVSGQVKATDVDGDVLTFALGNKSPANGTVVVNPDGTWTYTPNKDYNGSDSFTVLVSDGHGGFATSTVSIGITPVNDPPVITDIPGDPNTPDYTGFDPQTGNYNVTTPEDTPISGQVKATDVDGDVLTFALGNKSPANGTVAVNPDGTWTYTPNKDYNGSDSFTVLVSDGHGGFATSTVTIGITPVNDPPVFTDPDVPNQNFDPTTDTYKISTSEDTKVVGKVAATDVDGDTLTFTLGNAQPAHGTVEIAADGSYTYTPSKDFSGSDSFTVVVDDGHGGKVTSTVTVNIAPVADIPLVAVSLGKASPDVVTITKDNATATDLGFKVTATNFDGSSGAVSAVNGSQVAGFGVAGSASPDTGNDGEPTELGYDSTTQRSEKLSIAFDHPASSATVQFSWLSPTEHAAYTLYDANGNVIGSGVVTGITDQIDPAITLKADNGTPISRIDFTAPGTHDDYLINNVTYVKSESIPISVTATPTDIDYSEHVSALVISVPGDATLSAGTKNPDGTWTLPLSSNGDYQVVIDPVTHAVTVTGLVMTLPSDHVGDIKVTATATVYDTVTNVTAQGSGSAENNVPELTDPDVPGQTFDPVTGNYKVTTDEDTPVSGQVKATDANGDTLTYTLGSASPAHGNVVVNADGTWTYTPGKDYNGSDSFTVLVDDGHGGKATSTVTIGVNPVNDPPVITDTPANPDHPGTTYDPTTGNYKASTPEDTPVSGQVKATDVDGDTLTFALGNKSPANGTVAVNADGTWTYTPAKDYNGSDSFTVLVSDGHGGTATSTVKIGVTPVNDNPTANPDQVTVAEDSVVTFDPRNNDSDVDGDSLTITAVNGHAISTTTPVVLPEGTISLNGNGTLTFTPAPNYNGPLSLTYTISDGHGGTAEAPITIDVTPVDDVAVVGSGSVSLSEEGLAGGIADNTGSPDTTNATSASGKLTVTDIDGGSNILTLSGPSGLTSGGAAITWSGKGTVDNPLVGSAGGKTIITASIDSNGNYQVSLQGPVDHANPNAEDVRSIQLTVQASNGVATSTGTLTLNIEDDSPASGNQTQYVSPATQSTNVMLIVDVSGSMQNALADTTVNGLKATIKGLLDNYGELGDVRVQIVTFSDSASARATWMTLADAKTFVDKLSANGGTNYDAALASAQSSFNASGKLAGAVNVSYFFSDGEPNKGKEVDTGSDKTKWESFLKANDIDSYAMGINGASSSNLKYLEPIAYNGGSESERPAVILNSNTAVKTYLDNSVVTVEHGSLASVAGADGLKAVTAFSAANQTSSTYDAATGIQTITLSSGSRIELNLTTGEYTYTRPAGNTGDTFSYTIIDKDGDKGSGTLTLTTVNHAPEGTDGTVTLAEDTSYHLQVSDFGFKDSDAGDRLSAVRINTLPTDGTLTLNGKAVVAGQVIAAGDIGSLVFKPDANENGAAYAKLTFSVADRAGAYDSTPNTLAFNVTPVNDAPIARIASHGGLLGLVDVSVDPILNFSSNQHLGVYDVDNNLTRIDVSVENLLSVGGLANDILGLIGLGGDHSKLTIDTALAQSYGFTISGNDTRHIVITSATAGGTVDYGMVNKLLATLTYDPAELLGISADLLPKMTIKATDAFGLSSTDAASAGLISVHADTIQDVLDTKVSVSASATVDSAVTLTHDALTGEFTHSIDVGLNVSTPLTLTGHSASSDVFAWSLSDHGTASAGAGTNGATLNATHAVDTIVDFDTSARSAGGDVLDLRDLLSGENTVGGKGNLSQFLDFDTTSNPGSTIVHVSSTGGFTAGYDAKAEDQTIVLQNVNLRGDLGLGASASDNQVIAELMTRGKLLVDNN